VSFSTWHSLCGASEQHSHSRKGEESICRHGTQTEVVAKRRGKGEVGKGAAAVGREDRTRVRHRLAASQGAVRAHAAAPHPAAGAGQVAARQRRSRRAPAAGLPATPAGLVVARAEVVAAARETARRSRARHAPAGVRSHWSPAAAACPPASLAGIFNQEALPRLAVLQRRPPVMSTPGCSDRAREWAARRSPPSVNAKSSLGVTIVRLQLRLPALLRREHARLPRRTARASAAAADRPLASRGGSPARTTRSQ
jgi:hypothetical protein